MKAKQIIAMGALASIAFAPQMSAQEAEIEVKTPRAEGETELRRDPTPDLQARQEAAGDSQVTRVHKASGLLGMEVKNQQDEKLGEIKDLVLDLKSGKLSYAVLAVGGFLGLGEKLLAVPVDAFQINQQDGTLQLNADKAKIEAAPGFAATNWPKVNDPNLEARTFWMGDQATGAPGGAETERRKGQIEVEQDDDKIYTDADKDKKVKGEVDVDID